jgi:hypothetical protein
LTVGKAMGAGGVIVLPLILLSGLILVFLMSYTMSMQRTTLAVGRLLVGKSGEVRGTGVQDAITPKSQTLRNVMTAGLAILIFVITTAAYAWYYGILTVGLCLIGSLILPSILGIRPGAPRLVRALQSDMESRLKAYLARGDNLRAEVLGKLIEDLKALDEDEIKREARR